MVPAEQVRIHLHQELPAAQAWAARRGFLLEWDSDLLEVRVTLSQAETNEAFFLRGRFDGYRALPPSWSFTDATWATTGVMSHFPRQRTNRFGSAMFISGGMATTGAAAVICAPFNRLAYGTERGPHTDWSLADWTRAGQGYVKALHLGDMLQAIARDFADTRGRMG
jgi:hypothetical protein